MIRALIKSVRQTLAARLDPSLSSLSSTTPPSNTSALSLPKRHRRRFRVPLYTSVGKRFVGIALLVSIAAFNTGNNPLYLLFGMMLSLIGISSVLPELILTQIQVQRQLPARLFAGQPLRVTLILQNLKQRIPCFSVVVWDQLHGVKLEKWPSVFFLRVSPQASAQASYTYTFSRRGVWHFDGFLVGSSFPFELFQKRIGLEQPTEVLVYPCPVPPEALPFLGSLPRGSQPRPLAGHEGDFFGLREYHPSESLRRVHWKSSAKRDQLLVRELERWDAEALTLCFYNHWTPPGSPKPFQPQDPLRHRQQLEHSVDVCAGLVQYLLSLGHPLALVTLDHRTPFGSSAQHFDVLLSALARLQFHGDPDNQDPTVPPPLYFNGQPQDRCVVVYHGSQSPSVGAGMVVARIPVLGP